MPIGKPTVVVSISCEPLQIYLWTAEGIISNNVAYSTNNQMDELKRH